MIDLVAGLAGKAAGTAASQALDALQGGQKATGGMATGTSFYDVISSMGTDVVNNLKTAETQSFKAVRGEADTREVVDALMTAEQSLQTAIAIRDKLVTAYLDITRMQI